MTDNLNEPDILNHLKVFNCKKCGKKCYYDKDYSYDVCSDCNIKSLEEKVKYLKSRPSLYILDNYLRENFEEDEEITVGMVLEMIDDFLN